MTFLLGFAHLCLAQKPQPVLTISFSGYDEAMKDIDVLAKVGNVPQLGKMLEGQLQRQEAGRMLFSLIDKSKPWGAVLSMSADSPEPVVQAVLPFTDVKPLVKAMQDKGVVPRELGGGAYEIQAGPRTILFKQSGSWTLLASSKEALDAIPSDPAALLGGLNEKYTAAVSIAVKNIPPQVREGLMAGFGIGFQMATQRPLPEQALNQIAEALKDLDTVLLGLAVDRSTHAVRLEAVATAVPGSKMARKWAKSGDLKTDMAGLADPNAAVLLTIARKLDDEDIAQTKTVLAGLKQRIQGQLDMLPPDAKPVKQLADALMAVLEKTIEGGKIDGGLMVGLAPKNAQVVAGAKIADGAKLNDAVKMVAERALKELPPEVAKMVKLDAETYQGVHFHVVTPPLAAIEDSPHGHEHELISHLFGDKVDLVLGIGDDSAYLAVSSDAAKTLKGVIDKSKAAPGKSAQPLQVSIALTPIARLIAEIYAARGGDKQAAEMVVKVLSAANGQDHVKLSATLIPNGSKVQLELEEGVLRLIGGAMMVRQQQGGGLQSGRSN
jgi:hypothetical protein